MLTASKRLAELKNLAGAAGQTAFKRITLASELLADNQWIADEFKGDVFKARDFLEADYFGDLCGAMSLADLLELREHFSNVEQWKSRKFNLKVLWAEMESAKATEPKEKRHVERVSRKDFKEAIEQRNHEVAVRKNVETKLRRAESDVEKLQRENRDLKERNHELQVEIAELRGRVRELERLREREYVAA